MKYAIKNKRIKYYFHQGIVAAFWQSSHFAFSGPDRADGHFSV
jgi:hypothetical protein